MHTDRQTDRQTDMDGGVLYKSTFDGTLSGISFISVLIQSDSASTVVMMAATACVSHHDSVLARPPFTATHRQLCTIYIVVAKSQHCRVR